MLREPTALGSGGTGSGGGAIRLQAVNSIDVNGLITANGVTIGAGGSVWLAAETLSGSGVVNAKGGNRTANPSTPGGGGGRIALDYVVSTFDGEISVAGGTGCSPSYGFNDGQAGTLWEPQRFESVIGTEEEPVDVVIEQGFQYYFTNSVTRHWNLTVNDAWFEVHDGSMRVHDLTLSNAVFNYDAYAAGRRRDPDMEQMEFSGDITLKGRTRLFLLADDYHIDNFILEPDAWLYPLGDTNVVNGGTVEQPFGRGVVINCQSALIDGVVQAWQNGFDAQSGPGFGSAAASHGGRAGNDSVGRTYGSLVQPTALGSAAYSSSSSAFAVHARETLELNGTIAAQGKGVGGNSGGSVWLTAEIFTGSGVVNANGGFRHANPSAPGGGGDRVALAIGENLFVGEISVNGGTGCTPAYGFNDGATGTFFYCLSPRPEGRMPESGQVSVKSTFTTGGRTNEAPAGLRVNREVEIWNFQFMRFKWSEELMDMGLNRVSGTGVYSVAGWHPDCRAFIEYNDTIVATNQSDMAGEFNFELPLGVSMNTITLYAPPQGAVIILR